MRFSLISAIALAAISAVSASPIEESLELTSTHLLARDVDSIDGKYFEGESGLQERGCGSTWYLTKCNYFCPCSWSYYPQNHCAKKRCYDTKKVGCRGKCPKASLRCGTCN